MKSWLLSGISIAREIGVSMEGSSGPKPTSKPATAFSCVRCFTRRVKCDRQQPCSACANHNAECVFRVPAPPRSRKKRTQEDALLQRLKRCETLLQQSGIDPRMLPGDSQAAKSDDSHGLREPVTVKSSDSPTPSAAGGSGRAFSESKLLYNQRRSKYIDK